jgi:hypothetical protein
MRIDEKKSDLVRKLVAHWIHDTGGNEVSVADLVKFLQSEKIQRIIPYSPEITDNVINQVVEKSSSKDFGKSEEQIKAKKKQKAKLKAQQKEYMPRFKAVIDNLSKEERAYIRSVLANEQN